VSPRAASLIIAPVEATSSFLRGSLLGPDAVVAELGAIELSDPDVGMTEPALGPVSEVRVPSGQSLAESVRLVEEEAERQLDLGRFPFTLGGEHTVTLGPLAAVARRWPGVGVVQLDAHADLRDEYEGERLSHACVMRRAVSDLGLTVLGLGIRSMSAEEGAFVAVERRVSHLGPREIRVEGALEAALRALPERIYLTVDMDVFDPAAAPGVGTPEAGGLTWPEVSAVIDRVAAARSVVAADLVEFAPTVERPRTARLAARVVVRVLLRSLAGSPLP
jgi:agmatinase